MYNTTMTKPNLVLSNKEIRKATIIALAAAAAAKKRKKTDGSGNSDSSGVATASALYHELQRGFDSQYVVDGSDKTENCDVIFIDPGKDGEIIAPFKDMDFFFYLRILNEYEAREKQKALQMFIAVKSKEDSRYTHLDMDSEEFFSFARAHDRLYLRYAKPLYNMVIEGQSIGHSRSMQHDDLEL